MSAAITGCRSSSPDHRYSREMVCIPPNRPAARKELNELTNQGRGKTQGFGRGCPDGSIALQLRIIRNFVITPHRNPDSLKKKGSQRTQNPLRALLIQLQRVVDR